jgi:flagellar biosynthetic protein FliQ
METAILSLCQQALVAVLAVSAPVVLPALAVGVAVSVLQTATQVQEQSLGHLPKLFAVCLALAVAGPWMLGQLIRFATVLFEQIPAVAGW